MFMKRLLSIFLPMLIIFGMTACASLDLDFPQLTNPGSITTEVPTEVPTEPPSSVTLTQLITDVQADSIQYYDCATSGNFAVIQKDGKYGLIDYQGELVLPIEYRYIGQGGGFSYEYLIADDGSNSYTTYMIDPDGNLQAGYPDGGGAMPIYYWYQNDYIVFSYDGGLIPKDSPEAQWYYHPTINQRSWDESTVLPVQELFSVDTSKGYRPVLKSEFYGLLDIESSTMKSDFVYEQFDQHNGFSSGLLGVKKDGKWGFVNEDGEPVIDHLYDPYERNTYGDYVYGAINDYIIVTQNGLWGLIDTQGNIVLEVTYENISQVNKDHMFWLLENGAWSLYQIEPA